MFKFTKKAKKTAYIVTYKWAGEEKIITEKVDSATLFYLKLDPYIENLDLVKAEG